MYWAASPRKLGVHSLMHKVALRKDVSESPQEGMQEILSRKWLTLWIGIVCSDGNGHGAFRSASIIKQSFKLRTLIP